MKHWRETSEIVERVLALVTAGRRAALATVVRILGSAYRRPGAKFLIEDDGHTLGGVSGGCLEADVREVARKVLRTQEPRLLHYDTGSDDRAVFGLGMGCNGAVDVFIEAATKPAVLDTLKAVRRRLEEAESFAVVTVVEGPSGVGRSMIVSAANHRAGSIGDAAFDREASRVAIAALKHGRS